MRQNIYYRNQYGEDKIIQCVHCLNGTNLHDKLLLRLERYEEGLRDISKRLDGDQTKWVMQFKKMVDELLEQE